MSAPSQLKPLTWRTALTVLTMSALWGGLVVAVKLGLLTFPPLWSAFGRSVSALPVIAVWARAEKIRLRPHSDEWGALTALGVVMFIQVSMVNTATNLTSAAYAVILLNTGPIFINLLSHFFVPGDRLTWTRVSGLTMAFAGICVVFLGKPEPDLASHPLLGNLLATGASTLLAVRMVGTKRLMERIEATRAVFWQVLVSMPLFLISAALLEPATLQPVTWVPVLSLLYQGVVPGGLCFIIWVRLLRDHPPGPLSVLAFPTPVFGLLLSAMVFSEKLTPYLVVGVLAVVTGIVIVARQPSWRGRVISPERKGSVEKAA